MTAVDRACEHLDRIRADDASRVVIMDLLDEISSRDGLVERLTSDLALLGPVTTPLNGQQCSSCYRDCCDNWTYCPSCGAQGRIDDRTVRVTRR